MIMQRPAEPEPTAEQCAQHPDAPVIGGMCGSCTIVPEAQPTPVVERPAGLDALLDHVAAGLLVEEPNGPAPLTESLPDDSRQLAVLTALADILHDEERAPDMATAQAAARIVLAEHARELADALRAKQGTPASLTYREDTAPGMDRAAALLELYARKLFARPSAESAPNAPTEERR